MGSTSIGRALGATSDFVTRNTEDLTKDPLRGLAAAASGGLTEQARGARWALENPGRTLLAVGTFGQSEAGPLRDAWDRNMNGQARELEVAGRKAGESEAAANKQIDGLEEMKRQQGLTKERDIGRARARSMASNSGGRSSTILTNPSAYTMGSDVTQPRKTLLGM